MLYSRFLTSFLCLHPSLSSAAHLSAVILWKSPSCLKTGPIHQCFFCPIEFSICLSLFTLLGTSLLVTLSSQLITGRLPWQPAGIKFTQCVSGQKSAFLPLQEKLWVGSKNDLHLLELSRRSLSACKVWGRSNHARRL